MGALAGASLCSGYGGLDLVARELLGGDVVVHGEQYGPACKVLDAHWPGEPNAGNITTADWSRWAGQIDWFTAGWPCQPWSPAGKQLGVEDERAIWWAVARAIRDLRPRVVLLENVAAIAPLGELGRALADLADLGFDAEWRCVRASDAGAPHARRRIFILGVARHTAGVGWDEARAAGERRQSAWAAGRPGVTVADTAGEGRRTWGITPGPTSGSEPEAGKGAVGRDRRSPAPDTAGHGRHEGRPEPAGFVGGPDAAQRGGAPAADADRMGLEPNGSADELAVPAGSSGEGRIDWAGYELAIRRWESILRRPAPAPVALGRRGGRQLSPLFVEWLMGLPAGWVTDVLGITRNEQLHLLGNGVVPQQALLAYRSMLPAFPGIERAA